MRPRLSEFPSYMFYEGILQIGATAPERLRKNVDFPWPAPGLTILTLSHPTVPTSSTICNSMGLFRTCTTILKWLVSTPYSGYAIHHF
ncbi:hypothetical protein DFJ58DRAFT_782742 [Suillus subalutaceus]|uniref:uncharacterized protein n=1 Tax=Suillus subalutaceus TaxID=48586 RepID=UPI001B872D9C|nr:uncharacterized protein DFJ58DRAFT_782742 [Suillus subalutaceus]KAG1858073.1 hypothetical protein DFJ58DRAFT_782742 [Suillus subalutaceus]